MLMTLMICDFLDRHEMQIAMTYPCLGDRRFSNVANIRGTALENDDFQTVLMIEMDMQGRQRQVMASVLRLDKPANQLALVVVINIGKAGNRMFGLVLL